MTREQKIDMFTMRLDGSTYEEIAEKYGVSRQYVHSIIKGCDHAKSKYKTMIYPNLAEWMIVNNATYASLSKSVYGEIKRHPACLSNKLQGRRRLTINEINKILELTGMTFEECFKEKTEND